jgi:hypothetical protein
VTLLGEIPHVPKLGFLDVDFCAVSPANKLILKMARYVNECVQMQLAV